MMLVQYSTPGVVQKTLPVLGRPQPATGAVGFKYQCGYGNKAWTDLSNAAPFNPVCAQPFAASTKVYPTTPVPSTSWVAILYCETRPLACPDVGKPLIGAAGSATVIPTPPPASPPSWNSQYKFTLTCRYRP